MNIKEWFSTAYTRICDAKGVPYIAVDLTISNAELEIPPQFHQQSQITFNIGLGACQEFFFNDTNLWFRTRFDQVSHDVVIPYSNIGFIFDGSKNSGVGFAVPHGHLEFSSEINTSKPKEKVVTYTKPVLAHYNPNPVKTNKPKAKLSLVQ